MTKNGRLLVTGGTACGKFSFASPSSCYITYIYMLFLVVKVWRRPNKNNREKADALILATALCGHSDTVLCLVVSQEWSIIVSGTHQKSGYSFLIIIVLIFYLFFRICG